MAIVEATCVCTTCFFYHIGRNFLRPTEIQTDVVTWARLVRQAAPHHPDTLSPMPLQSDSSARAEENGKARRYSLNDMHHGYSSEANRPLSPSSKSGPNISQTHSLPKVLNGDDIPYDKRTSRGSLYKDPTIENELSGSNIQGYLESSKRRSTGPLKMDTGEVLTPEKMLSDNPEFNVDPDIIIPPPPDFSGDARDYSSGDLELSNHLSHQRMSPMNDQYQLEDLDVNTDEIDLKTTTFVNSYYSQPPPSIGPSLIDDVKVCFCRFSTLSTILLYNNAYCYYIYMSS